jgi:hypothetical protein
MLIVVGVLSGGSSAGQVVKNTSTKITARKPPYYDSFCFHEILLKT